MKVAFWAIFILSVSLLCGCGDQSADLSKERSPSASGKDVKSSGPAQLRVKMDKLQTVGKGDGVMVINGK